MPTRLLKESIHQSERLNTLTDFQFRLWVNLIPYVDDFGRGDARPAIIKGTCFPLRERLTNADIEAALQSLAGAGCVSLYEVDGKPYLYFPRWESHQNVRNKKSKYPAPPKISGACEELNTIANNCIQPPANVPVIQSNPNPNPNPSITTTTTARAREESLFAVDYFRNHLNPTAPEHDFREIAEYVTYFDGQGGNGNALVIKACQSAQSNRAFTWNYVRAILEKCKKTGIKTVSEFEAAERDRERQKGDGKNGRTGANSDAVSGNAQGFGTKL